MRGMELLTPTAEITPLQRAQSRLVHNTTHSKQTQSIPLSPVKRFSTWQIKPILCFQCLLQFTGSINVFRMTWDEITSSGCAATANLTQWHFKVFCSHRDARNSELICIAIIRQNNRWQFNPALISDLFSVMNCCLCMKTEDMGRGQFQPCAAVALGLEPLTRSRMVTLGL